MSGRSSVRMSRIHDAAKGPFEPTNREPDGGVRHPGKTFQDNQPVAMRARVQEATGRRERMKAAA
jgi:hypothetical protein